MHWSACRLLAMMRRWRMPAVSGSVREVAVAQAVVQAGIVRQALRRQRAGNHAENGRQQSGELRWHQGIFLAGHQQHQPGGQTHQARQDRAWLDARRQYRPATSGTKAVTRVIW